MTYSRTPRHFSYRHTAANVRAQAPRAKGKTDESECAMISVDDMLAGGDTKQLAARIQESMLAPESIAPTVAEDSSGRKTTLVASSAPEWMDGLELEGLELDEDLLQGDEIVYGDEEEIHINPSTGLSAGWTISVPGKDDNPRDPPNSGWSVSAVSDPEPDLDEETLQTSSRALRKVIGTSEQQGMLDANDVAEARLQSLKPHEVKRALKNQEEADENARLQKPAERKKRLLEHKRHMHLKIISGARAGTRLYSPAGLQTRPMMEKVRGALFSMLLAGSAGRYAFPADSRWLDLYAGTGAIGLEALSRGCGQTHFVELDPWVVKQCLRPNIRSAQAGDESVVHQTKAEEFLRRGRKPGSFVGGAFDFVSVTPPYMLVSYPEIFDLLEGSPLLHENSVLIVEYSKQNIKDIRRHVGSLSLLKSRRYGRTYVAVYGNNNSVTM